MVPYGFQVPSLPIDIIGNPCVCISSTRPTPRTPRLNIKLMHSPFLPLANARHAVQEVSTMCEIRTKQQQFLARRNDVFKPGIRATQLRLAIIP